MFKAGFSLMLAFQQTLFLGLALFLFSIGAFLIGFVIYNLYTGAKTKARLAGINARGKKSIKQEQEQEQGQAQETSEQVPFSSSREKSWRNFFAQARTNTLGFILALVFIGIAVGLPLISLGIGVHTLADSYLLEEQGHVATGEILRTVSEIDSEGHTTHKAVVRFNDRNDRAYQVIDKQSHNNEEEFQPGKKIRVLYDPEKPNRRFYIGEQSRTLFHGFLYIGAGLFFLIILALIVSKGGKEDKTKQVSKKQFRSEMYYPIYEYVDLQGNTHRVTSKNGSSLLPKARMGDEFSLYYDPDDNESIYIAGWGMPIFGIAFAAGAIGVAIHAFTAFPVNIYSLIAIGCGIGWLAFKARKIFTPASIKEMKTQAKQKREEKESKRKKKTIGHDLTLTEWQARYQVSVKTRIQWGIFWLILGTGAMGFGSYLYQDAVAFEKIASSAQGEIVEYVRRRSASSDSGYSHYPRVAFRDQTGKPHTFVGDVGQSGGGVYVSGKKVAVLYDPEAPHNARIDRGELNTLIPLGILGAGGLLFLWGAASARPRRRTL